MTVPPPPPPPGAGPPPIPKSVTERKPIETTEIGDPGKIARTALESRQTGVLDLSASGLSNFPNGVIKLSDGSKVNKIDLSKNALKALPRDFSQFYEATHLDLSNNNFSHFAIAFTYMYNLVEIDLTNNSFETLSDLELDKMNPKTKIILTGNPINQQGLDVMETFNKGAYNIVF